MEYKYTGFKIAITIMVLLIAFDLFGGWQKCFPDSDFFKKIQGRFLLVEFIILFGIFMIYITIKGDDKLSKALSDERKDIAEKVARGELVEEYYCPLCEMNNQTASSDWGNHECQQAVRYVPRKS